MTLKTAQLVIINQLFVRHDGQRRRSSSHSQVGLATQVAPAAVARQAWRQLQQQGLIDVRGRLTLAGLAVAVALRARVRRSVREAAQEHKPASGLRDAARSGRLLLAA